MRVGDGSEAAFGLCPASVLQEDLTRCVHAEGTPCRYRVRTSGSEQGDFGAALAPGVP